MATEFIMPKLGLTMEEGTITEWLVGEGDTVIAGTAVLRIETDKTETDVEAPASGRLHQIAQLGQTFACGERIGWFLADGEPLPGGGGSTSQATVIASADGPARAGTATVLTAAAAPTAVPQAGSSTGRVMASPMAKRIAAERGIDLHAVRGTGPNGRIVSEDLDGLTAAAPAAPAPAASAAAPSTAPRAASTTASLAFGVSAPATAAARQLADLLGIDLAQVAADPLERRITRDSVALYVRELLAKSAGPAAPTAPSAAPAAKPLAPATQPPSKTVRLSGMRGTIARRMHESLQQMAQLTLHMDADLDAVVADRDRRRAAGAAPSYTDYVVAAAARALAQHPIVNSQITDDGVALLPTAHVGLAVALDEGLIVPVIRDTRSLDLAALSVESARLAEAARSGSLALTDLEGGTFSVSTLGMFGVDGFTPVINPPNTAILGVGRLRDDVVLGADGAVATTKRLTLSLTWDHRAFDGAPAAAFCRSIVELLNDPSALDATEA